MKPRRLIFSIVFLAAGIAVVILSVMPTLQHEAEQASEVTSGDCSPVVSGDGEVALSCGPDTEPPFQPCGPVGCGSPGDGMDNPHQPIPDCIRLGVSGPCLDRILFSHLERAEYAFNAPQEMSLAEPQTIALVLDTTGTTDFSAELMALPGAPVRGETPISLIMEAEIVGPAFEITPSGRQRRELSELNPTRWDWQVAPTRSGEHQLEVSLYVIASRDGESIGEEKALAERRIIMVTVPPLNRVTDFLTKIDPILAFLVAIGGAVAAVLAWFGFKSWRDVSGRADGEDKPQKIEVTIKDASDEESH